MTIRLTTEAMRALFPRAPQAVLDAFVAKQDAVLTPAGINHTRQRLKYFFANIEHECGGFTIPRLTENINYTAERMAAVWPNRFSSAAHVREKYGTAPGWQHGAFDDIYGGRMGNVPGTHDGSTFIGRGGPQWTGRGGYAECQDRTGLPALSQPDVICGHAVQPEVCAAFWSWKRLNAKADVGDFKGAVRLWNGGTNGLADRLAQMKGNDPIIDRLNNSDAIESTVNQLPGKPPTATPPKEVINEATAKERKARKAAAGAGAAGAGNEGAKTSGTVAHDAPLLPSIVAYSVLGLAVVVAVVATVMIAKKRAAVVKNWF
ncbi:glycoside hydrolase family 19 protein [Bradyrhizobium sp. HKCCYLS2038]|uniref:glycoside hydrolase family 19 protein n=1 Tax=Bradyrhizobium sp. HKCCYLS2038 TaxID=3420764 RepID=UPI003EBE554F